MFVCDNECEFVFVGFYKMQANELLLELEKNNIDMLNNQSVMNGAGDIKSTTIFGEMNANVIETELIAAMPDPQVDDMALSEDMKNFLANTPNDYNPG